ncbi:MAG: hypothetical protein HND45_12920 [Chloroflexi bacterium]|nr:hypothetical protein [Chloroflexota bacterium]WKZ55129.1 MAG: hypothetical protein QY324_03700 [Anaerolineales bacterium]
MNNTISVEHIVVLVVVNLLGFASLGLISYIIFRRTEMPKSKMMVSVGVALVSAILWAMICLNFGIYSWIKSSNIKSVLVALPLFICVAPSVFPMIIAGTYLQLTYKDKIRGYVDNITKRQSR